MQFAISPATPMDVPAILNLVRQLAEYERLSDMVVATEADFHQALFGERPVVRALLAFADNRAVGFALFFSTFSTFLGRPGLYLEDIYVEQEFRGQGIGGALLARIAKIACQEKCGRVEWAVLTWNQPSIDFYRNLGAETLEEWRTFRLTGKALENLASRA